VVLSLVDVPEEKFRAYHSYEFLPEPVRILLRDAKLLVSVGFAVAGEDEPDLESISSTLQPLLERHRSAIEATSTHPYGQEEPTTRAVVAAEVWDVHFKLNVSQRGRTIADAVAIGRDVLSLAAAATGGVLTPSTARDLVRARRADLLLGQAESHWLECKQQPHRDDERGKLELAKDVASFANSRNGGLLVIGLSTKRRGEQDIIAALRPFPVAGKRAGALRRILDHRIYPPVENLEIDFVGYGETKAIVTVFVPGQPIELRPFLVRGAIVDGKVIGSLISVVRRRGDETIDTSISALHAAIARNWVSAR
jgi:Putative DNA-binding domain